MDERKRISLIYQYDDNWIGGTYYILSIIKAINFLPDKDKPFLSIYYSSFTPLDEIYKVNYPYIEYIKFSDKLNIPSRIINRLSGLFLNKNLVKLKLPQKKIENFYYRTFNISNSNIEKYYCWIPDFQDLHLPQFFSKAQLQARLSDYKQLVEDREKIVFSSNAALTDFNAFFPENINLKKVIQFVSFPDSNYKKLSIEGLKKKFGIDSQYFIVSNQFWKHKNHKIVLQAFSEIYKTYPSFQLVLTGKEFDNRDESNSEHISELKEYVLENKLQNKILFLGFIDRNEQLKLMDESLAIIQPSLFEGWSTVVEDAKFLNKQIICSDILVHREQLPDSEMFFEPSNLKSLISIMEKVINKEIPYNTEYDHSKAILKFAYEFINIF